MEEIITNIRDRRFRITVVGSGYVGLPTATLFADAGFTVIALDIKPEIVEAVNGGFSFTSEPGLQMLISRNVNAGRLRATLSSSEALGEADAIIVAVQTPIDQNKEPDLSFLMKASEEAGKALKKGMLLVISSTVPPGTVLENIKPKLESISSLEAEADFYLAYVPERIAPGKVLKEFFESPRLVGGVGSDSTRIAAELFRTVSKEVIETDAATTEVAKLAENTFRDVNIAFANQLSLICEQYGVDAAQIIKLANTHPRVNIHAPGPGVGGPCLTKDPYLLIHKAKLAQPNIIKAARQVNDYMPNHIIKITSRVFRNIGKRISTSKIAVLGTAYKANVDDSRLSPSKSIIQRFLGLGARVVTYDPCCAESFGAKRAKSSYEAIEDADCLVIITDHIEFQSFNLKRIRNLMKEKPVVIDGRRLINPSEAEKLGIVYKGIGLGERGDL